MTITEDGIVVPLRARGPMAVRFDGAPIWSFDPRRDGRPTVRGWSVPWPGALAPYLDGVTRVEVAEHAGDRIYHDAEVRFGPKAARIAVTDRRGNPLAVTKVGTLTRPFGATTDAVRHRILTQTSQVLRDLRVHAGAEAFLNYGALLGAVRDGRMIGHDSDTDVCYLSSRTRPVDVITESYRIERVLRAQGWDTIRMSGGDFKVVLPTPGDRNAHLDVFAAFYVGDTYYQLGNRSGRLPKSSITPLSSITLDGVTFPAPRQPEAMLAFNHGPHWRTPDPAFKFADPPAGVRRLDGWLRGFRTEQPRWNRFYGSAEAERIPRTASAFAHWAHDRMPSGAAVADIGCGTGRDSAFFARKGRLVTSFDCSPPARAVTRRRVRRAGGRPDVRRLLLNELRLVTATGGELALAEQQYAIYARGVLAHIDPEARANLWRLARMSLHDGGSMFVEFSAIGPKAPVAPSRSDGRGRRLCPTTIATEIARHGGAVIDRTDGPGFDLFDDPDPRVVAFQIEFPPRGGHHHAR